MKKQYVILPKTDFEDIYKGYLANEALECGGVDNWEWYCDSLREFAEGKSFDEFAEKDCERILKEYSIINIDVDVEVK